MDALTQTLEEPLNISMLRTLARESGDAMRTANKPLAVFVIHSVALGLLSHWDGMPMDADAVSVADASLRPLLRELAAASTAADADFLAQIADRAIGVYLLIT